MGSDGDTEGVSALRGVMEPCRVPAPWGTQERSQVHGEWWHDAGSQPHGGGRGAHLSWAALGPCPCGTCGRGPCPWGCRARGRVRPPRRATRGSSPGTRCAAAAAWPWPSAAPRAAASPGGSRCGDPRPPAAPRPRPPPPPCPPGRGPAQRGHHHRDATWPPPGPPWDPHHAPLGPPPRTPGLPHDTHGTPTMSSQPLPGSPSSRGTPAMHPGTPMDPPKRPLASPGTPRPAPPRTPDPPRPRRFRPLPGPSRWGGGPLGSGLGPVPLLAVEKGARSAAPSSAAGTAMAGGTGAAPGPGPGRGARLGPTPPRAGSDRARRHHGSRSHTGGSGSPRPPLPPARATGPLPNPGGPDRGVGVGGVGQRPPHQEPGPVRACCRQERVQAATGRKVGAMLWPCWGCWSPPGLAPPLLLLGGNRDGDGHGDTVCNRFIAGQVSGLLPTQGKPGTRQRRARCSRSDSHCCWLPER